MSATPPDTSFAGEIYRIVERHRRELLRMERAGATEMVRAYGEIWRRLKVEIERLMQQYREAGGTEGVEWLFQYQRLESLQRQAETEIRRFASFAEQQIVEAQREAVTAAEQHFEEIMRAGAGARISVQWKRLPMDAVSDLVGFTRTGSPLRELLDELGPEASRAVRDGLIQGVALGKSPRAVARQIRSALGGNLTRALLISRTETMRSYREATRRNYQENKEYIAGWRWLCAKNPRVCPACLAMDGTFHKLSERLTDHPAGRCVAVPVLRGQEKEPAPWETGEAWLAKQDEETQRRILGQAGAEAYRSGAVQLTDFVGIKSSRKWGPTHYAKSIRSILGAG